MGGGGRDLGSFKRIYKGLRFRVLGFRDLGSGFRTWGFWV